ncbi:copper resistance protein CopC [Sulfitobacter sp. D35]|uniref:copper resistance CopC family protein n=1 Tax=Sulfitobacter sp. D35 TaxID=3083252 RepID=UPI00296E68EA|nr:copper resistance protein CopC [Sulfitobacter sp. D35]MDW4497143.1 copper resistance protein CopC [Sulfitobacter sp. D35]
MKSHLALAVVASLLSGAVLAHSRSESTTPTDGAKIAETPQMIRMIFDDPMRITTVRLVNADGTEMRLDGGTGLEPSLEFIAEPAPLAPGSYRVEWRGLASDGHAMKGSFSFEVTD